MRPVLLCTTDPMESMCSVGGTQDIRGRMMEPCIITASGLTVVKKIDSSHVGINNIDIEAQDRITTLQVDPSRHVSSSVCR